MILDKDRIWGCILGGAIGDALGIFNELKNFQDSDFEYIQDFKGGGIHNVPAGTWSDDTSMSLCTIESLVLREGFHPEDMMERFTAWYTDGHLSCQERCFDIGITTKKAIFRYMSSGQLFNVNEDVMDSGNGSLMRIYPVVLWSALEDDEIFERHIIDCSRLVLLQLK